MNDILTRGFEAQARALREFGYSGVTPDMVKTAHDKWMRGEPMQGVIAMFCKGAFNNHPEIFGEPAACLEARARAAIAKATASPDTGEGG